WRLGLRRTRRHVRAASGRVDLRPIVRANMKHGGELVELPRRARREKPRPIVVLADVSGSMERYARLLLQFVYGMTAGAHAVESFVFATRLTRITREVARAGGGRALGAVADRVRDWGGGTRIGDALRAFNLHYARRVMRHGPVVLIISDGWDRGDPALLARELARVGRSCRRLVWLNPLLGSERYEPLTRGMRAALPLVDDFLPAHNLASLDELAAHLRSLRSR
ncbi:MAG: vWA domain-containing protein, partial [Vicinamibacterales bacterium]